MEAWPAAAKAAAQSEKGQTADEEGKGGTPAREQILGDGTGDFFRSVSKTGWFSTLDLCGEGPPVGPRPYVRSDIAEAWRQRVPNSRSEIWSRLRSKCLATSAMIAERVPREGNRGRVW